MLNVVYIVRYGYLSYEMYRACRLVVDTGMHALKWSRQDAVDYIHNHTALTLNNIEVKDMELVV